MRLALVVLAGALAAACTVQETRTVVPAARVDDACSAYGYVPGTEGYRICPSARRRHALVAAWRRATP